MKKLFFAMLTLAVSLCLYACGNENADNSAQSSAAASVSSAPSAQASAAEPEQTLEQLVSTAKAEGAKWSADQWKECMTKALNLYKPFAVEFDDLMKNIGKDPDIEKKTEELEKKYPKYPEMMNELAEFAAGTENGKAIDEKWLADKMKELGIPDMH